MCKRNRKRAGTDRRGAVVVLVAVTSTIMVGFAAMTIDIGNMYIVRTELQRAADSAALAGVSRLAKYQSGASETAARNEAERIVEGNPVDGKTTRLDLAKDVEFGHATFDSSSKKYSFVPGGTGAPTAVRVTVRKTKDSPNGSLHLFFANFYGSEKSMSAKAAAMFVPRDISVVTDLSGSMNYDSQLQNYKVTPINLWNIWVCLPIEKGNNGVGNGIDPPPPGNPPLNDGYGTSPGNPGNRGGADPKTDPGLMGPTWGRMASWGTLDITSSYDPTTDSGLMYLPSGSNWSSNTQLKDWFNMVGYSQQEINTLTGGNTSDWKYRVAVALGLARWDSGKNNGLWSTLPKGKTKNTKGNGDDTVSAGELAWMVDFPYSQGSWIEYIDTYMNSTSTWMYQTNADFRCRFGLKTFVNYMLEKRRTYADNPDLAKTPEQPVQAVKDALKYCMDLLTSSESSDHVSLEVYATTTHHEKDLTGTFTAVSDRLTAMQAAYYDNQTNMGGGIDQAIRELTGTRGRPGAAKVMFLMTDGNPNIDGSGSVGDSGGLQYALTKAAEAAGKGIQIYCISVGAEANRTLMQQIAGTGHGEEFYAAGTIDQYSSQLKDIFAELGSKRVTRLIE